MKSNPLLKWLLIPVALLVVFIAVRFLTGPSTDGATRPGNTAGLTPEEMAALGIGGDTPRDTVATLVAQVKQLRSELQGALTDNRNQKSENERLRARESTIDQRIQSALDSERGRLQQERERVASDQQETKGLLQQLQSRLDGLGNTSDLPVGLGLEDGDGAQFSDGLRWVAPTDVRPDDKAGTAGANTTPAFATSFDAQSPLQDAASTVAQTRARMAGANTRPVYTVPANATLIGSVAMTALIGRVPVDGTVNDPYPFKVLIGPDNLTANGIDIPDVAGAVIGGTASGDWTLSCVRGQVRSITFVFHDGTIRTVSAARASGGDSGNDGNGDGDGNRNRGSGSQDGLGWISDPYGIPCVSGERRSNAQQYLGSQALITAAGAGAASLIDSDSGSVAVVSSSDGSLGTVGISGNEAMGRILAGGVQDMSEWVNKLYGQAFAAVYVQPGAKVAVHIDQPLNIDYDPDGRRVDHRLGDAHAPDLD